MCMRKVVRRQRVSERVERRVGERQHAHGRLRAGGGVERRGRQGVSQEESRVERQGEPKKSQSASASREGSCRGAQEEERYSVTKMMQVPKVSRQV